ncbi:MAG TPA: condensation domain-containing protein [Gordonia sp. (in: high G+C Gram-positive bacteria)]|nr:condensation domain-containing protein [Gordonia sp. (in: high G+C Gram-positive bacteria)]
MTVYERGAQLQAGGEPDGLAPAADRYVPLSAAQRSIWFAQQLAPGTAFSIAQYVDVSGELDTYLLTDAGRQVAREFGTGMVRLVPASIVADGDNPTGAPFQAIDDEARVEFIDLDLRTESDPEAAARAWMDDEFRGPLDLFADRLLVSVTLRIADRRWFWYSRVHHILLDGYGSTAFTERVAQVYTGRILGIEVQPSRAGSLADLYADDLAYRSSTRFERDREHWAGRLADLPAPIRLTHLGISSTPEPLLEAVTAFGGTNKQRLWKVELPYALPQIMAGLNQTIMLSLSMVVIAALVGAAGLGVPVVRALNSVNTALGFESGFVIVVVAIILDRMLRIGASK